MNILAIDTTGSDEIIALHLDDKDYVVCSKGVHHSEDLLTNVQTLLKKAHITLNDIDIFGCVSGPGSFTGIRIGLTTIKAFAYALNKRVVNISKFDVLKSAYSGFVVLKCTKTSVYYANIAKTIKYGVCDISKLNEIIGFDKSIAVLEGEQIDLPKSYNNVVTIAGYKDLVLKTMVDAAKAGKTITSNQMTPLYIQISQAERNLKEGKHD